MCKCGYTQTHTHTFLGYTKTRKLFSFGNNANKVIMLHLKNLEQK